MRSEWRNESLASLCKTFADGDWIESKDQSQFGIRLIQTGNVGNGVFKDRGEKARYISEATFDRLRCTEIRVGDCLISRFPDPVGRSCIVPETGERMITAVDCTIARFDQKRILPELFVYYSQSELYTRSVDIETTGTTRKRVSRSALGKTPVPVPPLAEQQRIVTILDKAFAGIATAKANADANVRNARAVFESHRTVVFCRQQNGWVVQKLGNVAEVQSGGTPSVHMKAYWGGDVPWYSSGELNDTYTVAPRRYLTPAGLSSSNAKLFPLGSLLLGMYDTAALKMSILDREGAFNQAIAGVKPNRRIDLEFILHAIEAIKPRLLLERRGVRQKNLSLGKMKEIEIPFPDVAEQRQTVSGFRELIQDTKRLAAIYTRKLALLDELKQSLLHHAFTGQL